MTWTVAAIPREGVRTVWPIVAPLLAEAVGLAGGRMSMRTVLDWLTDGRYILWVAHEDDMVVQATFVTREAQYPLKKMLTIEVCGGTRMQDWLETADQVFRAHSREFGLDGVEAFGRLGWARALRRLGWRDMGVMVDTIA